MEDKKGLRGHLRNSIKRNNTVIESNDQEDIKDIPEKEAVFVNKVKQEKQVLQEYKEKKVNIEKKATFLLSEEILELIEREAYWERYSVKEIVQQIFNEHYQSKKYDPISANRKPTKRGPKPKK